MKTFKFLVLVSDSEYCIRDLAEGGVDPAILDTIVYTEEAYMTVVECKFERPEDNHINLEYEETWHGIGGATIRSRESMTFLRGADGKLYNATQVWTKTDLINKFE